MSVLGGAVDSSVLGAVPVKILDPRLAVNSMREIGVVKGARDTLWQHNVANSLSNSNINFNVNIADKLVINRALYLKLTASFAWVGTTTSGVLITPKYDALRVFPLQSVANTINLQLNNQSTSINSADYISALAHYLNPDDALKFGSGCPVYPDQYQDYSATGDSVRNQFGLWANTPAGIVNQRGAYTPTYTSDATTGSVTVTWYEPLVALSPLLYGKLADNQPGLANVTNLQLTLNLGDLSRMWSHDNTRGGGASNVAVITSSTVNITACELLINYLTPDDVFNSIDPARDYLYAYYQLANYQNTAVSVASAASTSVTSATISVESIPSRIYVFVNRQKADRTVTTTDTFARINSIAIQWNGRSGILSGADVHDLWRLSAKNGLQVPFLGFSNYQGSVLAIEPASDIGLMFDEAVGSLGRQQFQIQVNFTNTSAATVNYVLNVLVSSPGAMRIREDSAKLNVGLLSKAEVAASSFQAGARYRDYADADNVFGGNWFTNAFKDAGKWVGSNVGNIAKAVLPRALDAAAMMAPELAAPIAVGRQIAGLGYMGGRKMKSRRRVRGGCDDCVDDITPNQLEARMNGR